MLMKTIQLSILLGLLICLFPGWSEAQWHYHGTVSIYDKITVGPNSYSGGYRAIAMGEGAYAGHNHTFALGYSSEAVNHDSVALESLNRRSR